MLKLPVRKCFHVFKICLLLVLVVSILAMFEQWRGGKRSARAAFSDPQEMEYERQIQEDEARIIPGLGEGGVAAHLMGQDKKLGEESEKKLAINVHLSDRIAYNRTLKDYRNPACQRVVYDAELPSASVIIIFHNEPYSVVVRTIWSVVNSARRDNPWFKQANFVDRATGRTMKLGYPGQDPNSPLVYLKEIILVDDNSTLAELKGKLSHYVRTRLPPNLVRILRLPDRVGLTRARLAGARYATGAALVFLDAHCEAQRDWLRPLLDRVRTRRAVVVPIIDVIDSSTFYYSVQDPTVFQVGGFSFMGHFTWIEVPEREKKRRGSDIAPTWSPTMAGGLFAIDRAYYWEIGAYDEQMAGWGGENLEMSFRIWMCGGTLETIPCSRVGHVFRSFHPYGLPAHTDTHGINTARMAEVWMDEYAELFYLHRPDLRNNPKIGDVTHRKVLREKLRCKSFQWYLDNIYKEKFVPVRDVYGYGRFKNPPSNMCLDTLQREGTAAALGVYPCHARLQATQYFSLSARGELRDEESCAELQHAREESIDAGRRVLMADCHGKRRGQKWRSLPTGQLQHVDSGLCLDAGVEAGADILARPCADAPSQRWEIDYTHDNGFHMSNDVVSNSLEERLSKLRSQRRISRSLLSASSAEARNRSRRARKRRGRKRGKKRSHKKVKNKFILKVVRTLPNNSEEHLEVDIHCSHRRLYPNNSFVRDLVSALNDKDIKVINNGRVFEKNKVTDLSRVAQSPNTEVKVLHKLDIAESVHDTAQAQGHSTAQAQLPDFAQEKLVQPVLPPKKLLKKRKPGHVIPLVSAPEQPQTAHKKIIIEDFVRIPAMPPADQPAPQRALKRRKKKRLRTTTAAAASPAETLAEPEAPGRGDGGERGERGDSDDGREALLELLKHKRGKEEERVTKIYSEEDIANAEPDSAEDAPMFNEDAHDRRESTELWPIGESRFRSNDSDTARRKTHPDHHHSRDNSRDHSHGNQRGRKYERGESDRGETERGGDTDHENKRDRTRDETNRGSKYDHDNRVDSDRGGDTDHDHKRGDRNRSDSYRGETERGGDTDHENKRGDRIRGGESDRGHESDRGGESERGGDSESDRGNDLGRSLDRDRHRVDHNVEGMSEGETGAFGRHAFAQAPDTQRDKPAEDARASRVQQRATALRDTGAAPAPVKLVMRSNLTFNLGDEFFAWRTRADNNELTDELTIPTNETQTLPIAKNWAPPKSPNERERESDFERKPDFERNPEFERKPDFERKRNRDHERDSERKDEHLSTGGGVLSPKEDEAEDDSSTSDSGDHS